jgi:predicted amidohydrolase
VVVAAVQLRARSLDAAPAVLDDCLRLGSVAAGGGAELIVFHEVTYPGYVLGSALAGRAVIDRYGDPLETFAAIVRELGRWVVVGLALEGSRLLRNVAALFDPEGRAVGLVGKQRPWHFDARWYEPSGTEGDWHTPFGTIGAVICADTRFPEVVAASVAGGARLVCNPTAWVTGTPGSGDSIQPEFLISARAIENGVPIVAATKAGTEGVGTAYAGRSQIVAGDGRVLREAEADGESCLLAEVTLPRRGPHQVASPPPEQWSLAESPPVARIGVAICVDIGQITEVDVLDLDLLLVGDEDGATAASWPVPCIQEGRSLQPSGPGVNLTPNGLVEIELSTGGVLRVAVANRREVLDPIAIRQLAARGADALAVVGDVPMPVLRARAAENRLFVAHASASGGLLVDPGGRILAQVETRNLVMSADVHLALARSKRLAPGTHCAP